MLGASFAASCVQIEDASDKKASRRTADSAAGLVVNAPPRIPASPASARFGPDSVTRVRGGPQWTAPSARRSRATRRTASRRSTRRSCGCPTAGAAGAAAPTSPAPRGAAASHAAIGALLVPVRGIEPSQLHDTYAELRGGDTRTHEALDIPAPRGTPVLSATGGRVLKLFDSKAGGKMVYAADSSERFILMYAHLDSYANGLAEGQPLHARSGARRRRHDGQRAHRTSRTSTSPSLARTT